MRRGGRGRAAVARDRALALALFAAATVALGLGEIALLATFGVGAPFALLVLVPVTGWVHVAAGVLAWVRRPSNRMGPLLCAGGLMWFAAGAVNIAVPAFLAVGLITQTLTIALAVHALHGARLPASVEGTAYHVVAEALTNAVKHAQATALTVVIGREAGLLRIEVVDDGVGGAAPVGGAGLRGMADRVPALGGQLLIHSPPGAGTRLTVEMPCVS